MKYFILLSISIFITACSVKKPVTENKLKAVIPPIEIIKDSIKIVENKNLELAKQDTVIADSPKNEDLPSIQIIEKQILSPHKLWDELLKKHVSINGNVNYKTFKNDHKKLLDYINILNIEKSNTDFESFSKEEKFAYWINAYNALTIDLIIRNYPIKSIKDIKDPWGQRLWKLNEKWYSLNDIEHKILRKMEEPRIHFAIVCASVSCPKLSNEAFNSENLEQQLTKLTKEFLNDVSKNSISKQTLQLSKIFQWFTEDFTKKSSLIEFLNQYSDIKISNQAKNSFKDYNWNLNE